MKPKMAKMRCQDGQDEAQDGQDEAQDGQDEHTRARTQTRDEAQDGQDERTRARTQTYWAKMRPQAAGNRNFNSNFWW